MAHTVHLSSEKTGCLANSSGHGFFPTRVPVLADGPASTSRESTPSLQQPYEILAGVLAKHLGSLKRDVQPHYAGLESRGEHLPYARRSWRWFGFRLAIL